uniref:Sigma factor n=1 Tax=Pelargonium tetragonum TaxID=122197 RepID=A0A0G2SWT4_9ROSI|nr:sigma factor [Pelargonium tetragonum]
MSSCLLPHFKCQPDTFSPFHFRTPTTTTKIRGHIYFQTQCTLSTMSPPTSTITTTMLDMEKLQISSLEAHLHSVSAAKGPLTEANFEAALAREALLRSDQAVITAAAEAVALAKAAVKITRDAKALMPTNYRDGNLESRLRIQSDVNATRSGWVQPTVTEVSEVGVSSGSDIGPVEDCSTQYPTKEPSYLESMHEELKFFPEQFSTTVAVRSTRQRERKVRRAKAAEKASSSVVAVKPGSTSRKKRVSSRRAKHYDPLLGIPGLTSSKLLTAAEERELSEGVQDLVKLEKLRAELAKLCGGEPTFAQWAAAAGTDQRSLRKRLDYSMLCKEKMVESNVRLVISVAKKYQGYGMGLLDLVQAGCVGLITGVEKFDGSRGFRFSTYAHRWIKQACRKSLTHDSKLIRVPARLMEAKSKARKAREKFVRENKREPDDEELAKLAGLTMKMLSAVAHVPKAPRSLDRKVGIDGSLKLSDIISDPNQESSEQELMKEFMKQDLDRLLNSSLSPKEQEVIRLRFGLDGERMLGLKEIGEMMSVSRERIRQMQLCAFRKLKNNKKTESLRPYLYS